MEALKQYFVLTKGGIVIFVLIGGLAGYAMGFQLAADFSLMSLLGLLAGLYLISSGSFALNQAQESEIDRKMDRTKNRPIPSGWISRGETYWLGIVLVLMGTSLLYLIEPLTALLGLLTVLLYNGFYTLLWKRYWAFGAVPGAIPGAMPVVIGYSAANQDIFSMECLYLFMIMFLWQMPHFWAIAIKCREDYSRGGLPVLPVRIGEKKTVFHIGLYTFVYTAVAMASPWFIDARYVYLILVLPVAVKLIIELFRYANDVLDRDSQKRWLSFFLWVNVSLLVFLAAPIVDKWSNVLNF